MIFTRLYYRPGYRCVTSRTHARFVPWYAGPSVSNKWIAIRVAKGLAPLLVVREGYAWDGPSGPAISTRTFMRASLFHDALYQLIREGHLAASYRKDADQVLRDVCLEDGMCALRAWWVYHAVRLGAGYAARGDGGHPELIAP